MGGFNNFYSFLCFVEGSEFRVWALPGSFGFKVGVRVRRPFGRVFSLGFGVAPVLYDGPELRTAVVWKGRLVRLRQEEDGRSQILS